MLKLLPIEFFLRAIPEAFLLILVGHAFGNKYVNKRKVCISTVLLAIATYLIRMLPIHFGVHTIILIMIYVLITVYINKLDVIKSISAVLTSSIMLFFCEWINVFILTSILKLSIDIIFKDPVRKLIYLLPSIIMFGVIVILIFYINVVRRKGSKKCFL